MADTFTTLLNVRLQQTGGNDNTWGALLNTDSLQLLENAVAGMDTHAGLTGGSLDLSAAGAMPGQIQYFSGALIADQTVIIANLSRRFLVINGTTGAFSLFIKTSAGSNTQIPQSTSKSIHCIGSNGYARHDAAEVGEVVYFANSSVPSGFLECDGSSLLRASYPDLFAAIGTTWGSADGTHFTIPDAKTSGRFLRSRTGSVAVGTVQAADIAAHNHGTTVTNGTLGVTLNLASDGNHAHTINISDPGHSHVVAYNTTVMAAGVNTVVSGINVGASVNGNSNPSLTGITATSVATGAHAHAGSTASLTGAVSVTVNNSSGTETRPLNLSMICCIRY